MQTNKSQTYLLTLMTGDSSGRRSAMTEGSTEVRMEVEVCFCATFSSMEAWFMAAICCCKTNSKRTTSYKDQKAHTCDEKNVTELLKKVIILLKSATLWEACKGCLFGNVHPAYCKSARLN